MRTANTELTSTRPAKNPKRVAAGIRNRAKRKGLTPAGRERLRATALRHRPWRFATGPKTTAGKAQAAANGRRRQTGPLSVRQIRTAVGAVSQLVREMAEGRTRMPHPLS